MNRRALFSGILAGFSLWAVCGANAQTYDPFLQPYGPYGPDLRKQTQERYNRAYSGSWGCKAVNRATGASGSSWDYSSRQAAVNRALRECGRGCRITGCSN